MKTDFTIIPHAHLGTLNTFGIDAIANALIIYNTHEALPAVAEVLERDYTNQPVMHLGAGSNLLPAHDYPGVMLKSMVHGITQLDDTHIRVGAGETFDSLIEWCLSKELYGLENLSLIPGEVGASTVQNIGAYGAEVGNYIALVEGYNLKLHQPFSIKGEECRYAYRDSIFKHELAGQVAITHVTFCLSKTFTPNLSYAALAKAMDGKDVTANSIRQAVIEMRRQKLPDPAVLGNAGSFFKNPVICNTQYESLLAEYPEMPHYPASDDTVKVPAAWLIERCGWKGRSLGQAAVHDQQALVLVNLGNATGQEVVKLKDRIVSDVKARFGIVIEPEVNIL